MHIFYFSYPLRDDSAPHQAMAAFWLARQGFKVTFFAWGNEEQPAWLKDYPTLDYHQLPKRGLISAFSLLIELIRRFFQIGPNWVYVQGAQQTPFLLWLPFLKRNSYLIYHTQDYVGPGQHAFYEWCERFFARRADYVISNEINRARFMASSYRLKQMPAVIRTALPSWWPVPERDESYRQELLEKSGLQGLETPRLIVAGGAYRPDRMSSEVLQAFAQLPRNYALIFNYMPPGSPSRAVCEEHLQQLGLRERVIFLEPLPYQALLKLYAACDIGILIYPNNGVGHFYQAPGRLTEYLRCGLPIVTSAFPGLELLTLKYNIGSVADPYNPTAIATAIRQVGEVSNAELVETRNRLIALSQSELVYEKQAEPVFKSILNSEFDRLQ
jgi:glycosyltransferase involved in cell wall biosynthesis